MTTIKPVTPVGREESSSAPKQLSLGEVDLALLASRAAVELDNRLRGRAHASDAVRALAHHLRASMHTPAAANSITFEQLLDRTPVAVKRTLQQSPWAGRLQTVEDLVNQAAAITQSLVGESTKPDDLQRLRTFCVALSRVAAASESPTEDADSWSEFSQ
jgi:hypothetical protein